MAVATRVDDCLGELSGNALIDSPNREAYHAVQALAFVALKDDLEEGLVVAVVGREILEFVEHDKSVGGVAVDIASKLAVCAGSWSFVSERGEGR